MTQATCISCSTDTDLVSVHDELSLDGTESPQAQSSAAALVHYCFNFKIEKLDKPYGICSTCLGLLIQASSYKHHLLNNIDSIKESKDAGSNLLITKQLSKLETLLAKRNELWDEIIEKNTSKMKIDLWRLDFSKLETTAEAQARKNIFKFANRKRKIIKKTISREVRPSITLNGKLKNEFLSLHRDCKDFYLFSWGRSKFKCIICNKSHSDVDEFKIHIRRHSTKQSEDFFPKKNIYTGPALKVDVSTMKCRYCDKRMTELKEFRNHLSISHKINTDYIFNRILPFHLHRDKYKCGICNKVFLSVVNLNRHMNQHSTNYKCDNCSKTFATKVRLKNHIKRNHNRGTFKCFKCDEEFESIAKRIYHTTYVHTKCKHLCPHCPAKFQSYIKKLKHLVEVHNEEAMKYKCDKCQLKFQTTTKRSYHNRKVHLKERNFVCKFCAYGFFTIRQLNEHIVIHTGEKSFVCEICAKTFARHKNLLVHMQTHDCNKVKFSCEFCKNKYSCKSSLTVHLSKCLFKNIEPV